MNTPLFRVTCFVVLFACAPSWGAAQTTVLVSVNSSGEQANAYCIPTDISAHGRYVTIYGDATNLVNGDDNNKRDAFLRDLGSELTFLESVSFDDKQGNDDSGDTRVSADGRYVVFASVASNLVQRDENRTADVFVRDRVFEDTICLSLSRDGSTGDSASFSPDISADGRSITFSSYATNLIEDEGNGNAQVFVRDREMEETTRVSVSSSGVPGNRDSLRPRISADGRYVGFESDSTNLISGDTNNVTDVFIHDRETHKTERVSVNSYGQQADAQSAVCDVSADGRFVLFVSYATNLGGGYDTVADLFVRDRKDRKTTMVNVNSRGAWANAGVGGASISASGRFVAFSSPADNLVDDDTNGSNDCFVRDIVKKKTFRVSLGPNGEEGNGMSTYWPFISANGRFVAFGSLATNFIENDENDAADAFVRVLPCDEFLRGDSNCDGVVDYADIDAFVLALIDAGQYAIEHLLCDWECNNDINRDGAVDFNDIDGFVECLVNGGCP